MKVIKRYFLKRKTQVKFLKIKTIKSEMKKYTGGINGRSDIADGKINQHKTQQ